MPMQDDHTTTDTYNSSGQQTGKSIQGRALDPTGAMTVQERMRTTDLGALARAAAAKKAQAASGTTGSSAKVVQKKALSPEEKKEKSSSY
jgi:hypothetical protein